LIDLELEQSEIDVILIETSKTLMLDEYEIVHWVKHIDRFDFKPENFAIEVFFVGLATKLLLNDVQVKEPIEVYLSKINN
jgi:hypothetical protein